MIDLRSDLFEVRATKAILEKELHNLLLQLHAAQLQLHAKTGQDADSETIMKKLVGHSTMRTHFVMCNILVLTLVERG